MTGFEWRRWRMLSPMAEGGGGDATDKGAPPADTSKGEGKNPAGDPEKGGKPVPDKGGEEKPKEVAFTTEQQDAINAIIKKEKDAWKRKAEADAKTEKAKADGEWKTLAETHEARVKELEPLEEEVKTLRSLLNEQVDAEVKEWPAEVKALDPGADNLKARQAWLKNSRPIVEKLKAAPKAPSTEGGAGNRPNANKPADKAGGKTGEGTKFRFQQANDVQW